jgi:hypothetical protein
MQAPGSSDIRTEIRLKPWGNPTFNAGSAPSRATVAEICQYPPRNCLPRHWLEEGCSAEFK